MSTRPTTGVRTWISVGFAAILTATTWLAAQAPDHPQSFTTLQNGFTQQLIGTTPSLFDQQFGILGGVAFAPDGDVWSAECLFGDTRMHRFDMQTTVDEQGTLVHPETIVEPPDSGTGGCGLVNHPDGYIYSNSSAGIWRLDAETGLPVGVVGSVPGNSLGLAVDPQTNHIVYVGGDCHPNISAEPTCTLFDLDPSNGATQVFARLPRAEGMFLDGIYFDPSGNYVFGAHRELDFDTFETHHSLAVIRRPAFLLPMDVAANDSQIAQLIAMTEEPDGVAFHATEGFVVTLNESDNGPGLRGTISRFDFPSGYEGPAVKSVFASGGFRGDLLQVGSDGCIYGTQGKLYDSDGGFGTRYNSGALASSDSIVKICGGFAPPPAAKKVGSVAGVAYHDVNQNGVRESGEPGLAGVTITLSGAASATTTTDAAGAYSFTDLVAGSYAVSAPTTSGNFDRETASPRDASIGAGENRTDLDFGYVNGNVSGTVFADLNKNGVLDSGEPGLAGVTVTLAGAANATTTSGAGGAYSFSGLLAGSYVVGAPITASNLDRGTASPVDATITAGQSRGNLDFGYVNGGVSGTVFKDLNKNGQLDTGEPGIGGVTVTLAGNASATTTTAPDGSYSFSALQAGGYDVSSPATAGGMLQSTVGTQAAILIVGGTQGHLDFGYITGSISGYAYVDSNNNGSKDSGEAGIGGVTITLAPNVTTTTASDGSYSFTGLVGQNYSVSAPDSASGYTRSTTSPLGVTLIPGEDRANVNFGYRAAAAYVTFTQGGWGAKPSGNNPGMLLKNNFAIVYPSGSVTIGGSPYYLRFTSASAIEAFLPAGSSPGVLNKSATNPTSSSAGVFAGQVLALQLSVDFSKAGIVTAGLPGLKVASGNTLAGSTVTQVLALANQVLAGNTSALPAGVTVSKLNDLIAAINQNYDNGTTNNHVLVQ